MGGIVKGTLGLGKSPLGAAFKAQVQMSDVDLEQCLAEMFGIRRLDGKGNIAFSVEGSGSSIFELTKALNGTATLSSQKGAIVGFNVEQLLRRIERRPLSGGSEFRSGKTPYESLGVNLKIVDGIATVDEVRMTGSAVGLAMTGSASIPTRELDLKGIASLLSGAALPVTPAFELPFMVQGSWDDPIVLPDPQSRIERSGAAAPLLDALRQRGGHDSVRSAIERLSGSPPQSSSPPIGPAPTLSGSSTTSLPTAETTPAGTGHAPETSTR
jgi:AsmA protein